MIVISYPSAQNTLVWQDTHGNGICLPISHVGSNSFVTNPRVLHLQNLLLVPSITKNLISISQFCTDKWFFLLVFLLLLVKDQITKKVLLQGTVDRGLTDSTLFNSKILLTRPKLHVILIHQNSFQLSQPSSFFLHELCCNSHTFYPCSLKTWHERLRHNKFEDCKKGSLLM